MDNKLETILREIRTNNTLSTPANPRSQKIETLNAQQIFVRAPNIEKSNSENEGHPPKAPESKNLRHPAQPLYRNELDLDATIISNEMH